MQHNLHFLALIAALFFLQGCNQHQVPNQEEVLHLISVIPDHKIFPHTQEFFTPEYYSALSEAWALPSDAIGEIGSDEWLYYFISGNGDCDDFRIENISLTSGNPILVTFTTYHCGMADTHTLHLQRLHRHWVVADFDSTLTQLKQYIAHQRSYFQSPAWRQYLQQCDPPAARARQREIELYFQRYPL